MPAARTARAMQRDRRPDGARGRLAGPCTVVRRRQPRVGVFLHDHPLRDEPLALAATRVRGGQVLGLLQIGALLLPVHRAAGRHCRGHAGRSEGNAVGWGTPLIELRARFEGSLTMDIDLNADLGEGYGPWRMGEDEALLELLSSANVACGFHAGDPVIMERTVRLALARGVDVGAHVGFPDRQGFGRRSMQIDTAELAAMVTYQLGALAGIARAAGHRMTHMSFHGALGNLAAADAALAGPLVRAVALFDPSLIISSSTQPGHRGGGGAMRAARRDHLPGRPGLRRRRPAGAARNCPARSSTTRPRCWSACAACWRGGHRRHLQRQDARDAPALDPAARRHARGGGACARSAARNRGRRRPDRARSRRADDGAST